MKSEEWKSYRTRFLVNAKQLNSSLSFVDHLGRQHLGRKGDYLVESSDGVLSITPRRIFEDIYVPMLFQTQNPEQTENSETRTPETRIQSLEIRQTRLRKSSAGVSAANPAQGAQPHAARAPRKLPQPCRGRNSTASLGLM